MQKKMAEIEFDPVLPETKNAGYVFGARYSNDKERSLIFACGAGRSEVRAFDNDTEFTGRYKDMGQIMDHTGRTSFYCMDAAANGK